MITFNCYLLKGGIQVTCTVEEEPSIGTLGNRIRLERYYKSLEGYKPGSRPKCKWLDEMFEKHKRIFCQYCNKTLIKRPANTHICNKNSKYVTVDHFLPVSLYPDLKYDSRNFVTCCEKCNWEKGNKEWAIKYKY